VEYAVYALRTPREERMMCEEWSRGHEKGSSMKRDCESRQPSGPARTPSSALRLAPDAGKEPASFAVSLPEERRKAADDARRETEARFPRQGVRERLLARRKDRA